MARNLCHISHRYESGCRRLACFFATVLTFFILSGLSLSARTKIIANSSKTCESSAHHAALLSGIPEPVLMAISLIETGRKSGKFLKAWPWTVNMQGKGYWFETRAQALAFAKEHYKSGARSFDVGCFQINYKWHGHAFSSISAMFDPNANAIYAAKYLLDLYHEKGNWLDAVGAYHSRTPKLAKKYITRFQKIHASLTGHQPFSAPHRVASNGFSPNRYPLLQHPTGAMASPGSIVVLASDGNATALISGPTERLF